MIYLVQIAQESFGNKYSELKAVTRFILFKNMSKIN